MAEPLLPSDYPSFLKLIKEQVQQAQLKAIVAVNRELILLYWHIGKEILATQEQQGWGVGVVERLSQDLRDTFPHMTGFSPRNLKYMRAFAEAYSDEDTIVQRSVAQLPWRHNIALLEKVKDQEERFWYTRQVIEHGWTRDMLVHQIELQLFQRKGKAINNFTQALPSPRSEFASSTLKDPYIFDFLTLKDDALERDLQDALLTEVQKMLLELGTGFTFVGSNYHLKVDGDDFYIDLLFYHIRLRCFVVVDLKINEFKPEYAGKMNFYLMAVDAQVKHPDDNQSIGLILCKTKGKVMAEYAVKSSTQPLGVASYQYTTSLPKSLQSQLPDIKELEESLEGIRAEVDQG
jgi:predicted nuclease of restriction endonuclease-like (RecB) superfamily